MYPAASRRSVESSQKARERLTRLESLFSQICNNSDEPCNSVSDQENDRLPNPAWVYERRQHQPIDNVNELARPEASMMTNLSKSQTPMSWESILEDVSSLTHMSSGMEAHLIKAES